MIVVVVVSFNVGRLAGDGVYSTAQVVGVPEYSFSDLQGQKISEGEALCV